MDAVLTILSLHFVFDWIVATVVGVSWCYLFKLCCPQVSETLPGWALYTVVQIFGMPFVRIGLLRNLREYEEEDAPKSSGRQGPSRTTQGYRILLNQTCGTSVGTSLSGLMALTFPLFADLEHIGPRKYGAWILAVVMTAFFVLAQAGMEWLLHTRLADSPKDSYWRTLLDILLCSTWGFLGFFWNVVWDRVLKAAAGIQVVRWQPTAGIHGRRAHKTMHTIMDYWYGRPQEQGLTYPSLGMEWLAAKAGVTLVIALLVLSVLPEPPPTGERRFLRRRARLATQMVWLSLAAYALTDAGFYFGTRHIANETGSAQLGLAAAFGYALLVSIGTGMAGCSMVFKPRTHLGRWAFQLACMAVSYAWSYCWQELLYQTQDYGLSGVHDQVEPWLVALCAVSQTAAMTFLFAAGISKLAERALRYGDMQEKPDKAAAAVAERLQATFGVGDSMLFLASCSGLRVPRTPSEAGDEEQSPAARLVTAHYGAVDSAEAAA